MRIKVYRLTRQELFWLLCQAPVSFPPEEPWVSFILSLSDGLGEPIRLYSPLGLFQLNGSLSVLTQNELRSWALETAGYSRLYARYGLPETESFNQWQKESRLESY